MGEAKQKLRGRELVLSLEPSCIYFGNTATVTDHCPPRCFFIGRHWPEGFEFSCCASCNDIARRDEQALSVLVRVRVGQSETAKKEWEKLEKGVRNYQPAYIREWTGLSRNNVRTSLRSYFGKDGDIMRAQGWNVIDLGPLSQSLIERFLQRLATALYYHRNKERFVGVVHYCHQSSYAPNFNIEEFWKVLDFAPELVKTERNTKDLSDQFSFRCNYAKELGVLLAVVGFNPQQLYTICAFTPKAIAELNDLRRSSGQLELPSQTNTIHSIANFSPK